MITPVIPNEIIDKMNAWFMWHSIWNWTHYGLGATSAILSVVVAVNTKKRFLPITWGILAASFAAAFTFLMTAMNASAKAAAFEMAAREVEKAIALYQPASPDTPLREAVVRGIEILNER